MKRILTTRRLFKVNCSLELVFAICVTCLLATGCKTRNESNKDKIPAANTASNSQVPSAVKSQPPQSGISIHQASLDGDLSQVSMLLDGGIDKDILDNEGRTALMYAAFNGHSEIIKMLIRKGSEVNLSDINGTTALMMASSGPYPEAVKLLLDSNADPNLIDKKEHFTALMYASSEGQMEVVKLLLSYKANPLLKDVDGDDAAAFATNNGHPEVAALVQSFKNKYRPE